MTDFKLDCSNMTTDESLNRFRQSKQVEFKNLEVKQNAIIGKLTVNNGHVKSFYPDKTLYLDCQTNILQSAYTNDVDVIDTDKNTSFVDYNSISRTYFTKIGGTSDEYNFKNNKCVDKDNNLYVVFEATSDSVQIFDSTNNNVPVSDATNTDSADNYVLVVKYNHLGEFQWFTRIGGGVYKYYPSVVCDADGNVIVSCYTENDVKIYDTSSADVPVSENADALDNSVVIVKYNTDGIFQWTIHVDGIYSAGNPDVYPRITADINGNIYLSQYLASDMLKIYDKTPEEYVPMPTDFFCVLLNHVHTDMIRYQQPIYTFKNVAVSTNYVSMKFDSDGKFKWINHIELEDHPVYGPQIFNDVDSNGNLYICGNFSTKAKVFNPIFDEALPSAVIEPLVDNNIDDNMFIVKYDTSGSFLWQTKVSIVDDDVRRSNIIVDYNGNVYVSVELEYDIPTYVFDTSSKTVPKYTIENKQGYRTLLIIKYDTNGLANWYQYIDSIIVNDSGDLYKPCLAVDNRLINNVDNSHVYLTAYYYDDVNFYLKNESSHVSFKLKYNSLYNSSNCFISCFSSDGDFIWATKATSNSDISDSSIVADTKGHIYLLGTFQNLMYIYDANDDDTPNTTLSKTHNGSNDSDIFIIKYNRYGFLNNNAVRSLYIEDDNDLPDSFYKNIIIENNEHNGIINLNIVKKENVGYTVRRNVVVSEGIELISKNGVWIPNIISDQYNYSTDNDIVDINSKTSFVEYKDLQNTFYTHVAGDENDLNPQTFVDKYGNVYMAGVYSSNDLGIFDCSNNTIPVGNLMRDGDTSLFLTKYNKAGLNMWRTRVGGYNTKQNPSIFTTGNGDTFVAMQSYDDDDIRIYDVNNVESAAKTLSGSTSSNGNTVLVKYNQNGEFVWNARVFAINPDESPSFTATSRITGDLDGNLFLCGYSEGLTIDIYDSGSDVTPAKTFTRNTTDVATIFMCKFDHTGKLLWTNHVEGTVNSDMIIPPDLVKLVDINLNTDNVGNLYLTSNFYNNITVYEPDTNNISYQTDTFSESLGLFNLKIDPSGNFVWSTFILSIFEGGGPSFLPGSFQSSTCVDADGNLYITFSNSYVYVYQVLDTRRHELQPVYSFENVKYSDLFVGIIKFNKNGIFQWNNIVNANITTDQNSDVVLCPVITCDNKYITGQYKPSLYLQMNAMVNAYRNGFNFYNVDSLNNIVYTLQTKDWWMDDYTVHSLVCKYDVNGIFEWATTSASWQNQEQSVIATSICADTEGHVYVSGSFDSNNGDLYVWDVSTNGYNDDSVTNISGVGNYDIYLIKYNQFGLLNKDIHPTIYLEDNQLVPNAFEKSIIITNNTNNGPVNCHILQKNPLGFGFTIRDNISFVDCLDLISYNGKWIPKLSNEQINLSKDLDVIDVNTKLSVLDYNSLGSASWVTRIGGGDDEQNVQTSSDKNSNIYVTCTYTSNPCYIYSLNENEGNEQINKYGSRDVLITKYNTYGSIDWSTHIGFDTDVNFDTPSIQTDADGNSYITIVKTNDNTDNSVYIFDVRDNNSILYTRSLNSNATMVVKYDKDGVYQWDIAVLADSYNSGGTLDSISAVDGNGNVYVTGYNIDNNGLGIRDSSSEVVTSIQNEGSNGMFLIKFDKTGKYVWRTLTYNGIQAGSKATVSCDQDGNVIIAGVQNNTTTVYHLVNNEMVMFNEITLQSGEIGLFMIKYDTTGKCLWTNKLNNENGVYDGVSFEPTSVIDANGNYYLAVTVSGNSVFIHDTRSTDYRYQISIPYNTIQFNTFFAKFNVNGILQWYNFVSGYSELPSISVDNRFTKGIDENSVYLSGSCTPVEEGSSVLYFYNAQNDGSSPNIANSIGIDYYDSYLTKYTNGGQFSWCSKVRGSNDTINTHVHATEDGHVILGGDFNSNTVDVYQGSTLNMDVNNDIATTITNIGENTYDIFLIKYSRYGTVNNGSYRFGREVYIENDRNIPDGTEKSIVVINNGEYNGTRENVCLVILEYNNPSYAVFRNFWFSEGLTLVSYNGQWFIKSSSSSDGLPKRSIIMWGGNENDIPLGWHLCDGGSLNGVTTPDLRGRFIAGFNNNATGVNGSSTDGGNTTTSTGARLNTTLSGTVGLTGGEVLHTLTTYEMPTHNHGVTDPGHRHTYLGVYSQNGLSGLDNVAENDPRPTENTSYSTTGITINNTGGGQPHNNVPPYYVLCLIMKCY